MADKSSAEAPTAPAFTAAPAGLTASACYPRLAEEAAKLRSRAIEVGRREHMGAPGAGWAFWQEEKDRIRKTFDEAPVGQWKSEALLLPYGPPLEDFDPTVADKEWPEDWLDEERKIAAPAHFRNQMWRLPKPGAPAYPVKVLQWFLNYGFAESPRGDLERGSVHDTQVLFDMLFVPTIVIPDEA